jgi:hypothetical protein
MSDANEALGPAGRDGGRRRRRRREPLRVVLNIPNPQNPDREGFMQEIIEALQPQNVVEKHCADTIAEAQWWLNHLPQMRERILRRVRSSGLEEATEAWKVLKEFERHERSEQWLMKQAIRHLERLQSERQAKERALFEKLQSPYMVQ